MPTIRVLPVLPLVVALAACGQQPAPAATAETSSPPVLLPGGGGVRPQLQLRSAAMPLDSAAKEKLGGAMNLLVDPKTGGVRVLVVRPPDANGNLQLGRDDRGNLQLSPA